MEDDILPGKCLRHLIFFLVCIRSLPWSQESLEVAIGLNTEWIFVINFPRCSWGKYLSWAEYLESVVIHHISMWCFTGKVSTDSWPDQYRSAAQLELLMAILGPDLTHLLGGREGTPGNIMGKLHFLGTFFSHCRHKSQCPFWPNREGEKFYLIYSFTIISFGFFIC